MNTTCPRMIPPDIWANMPDTLKELVAKAEESNGLTGWLDRLLGLSTIGYANISYEPPSSAHPKGTVCISKLLSGSAIYDVKTGKCLLCIAT